jgi:hypothetical protein
MSTDAGRGRTTPLAEAQGLFAAFLVVLALTVIGLWNAPRPTGWLVIPLLDGTRTTEVFKLYFKGPACSALFQTVQVSLQGQYAQLSVPDMGTFEMQAPIPGLYAVRPLTEVREVDGCRFDPRYVGPSP